MQEKKIEFESRDYAKQPLTRAELKEIIDPTNVSAFLNSRHEVFKANNWKEKPPTKAQAIAAILKDANVIRRPIVKIGKRCVAGFDKAAYGKMK